VLADPGDLPLDILIISNAFMASFLFVLPSFFLRAPERTVRLDTHPFPIPVAHF
jgi:hypothetical protein